MKGEPSRREGEEEQLELDGLPPKPQAPKGYVYMARKSGSGTTHLWINNMALCRTEFNPAKYNLTLQHPPQRPCVNCQGVLKHDPHNTRVTAHEYAMPNFD